MNIIHIISNNTWGGGERYALDLCSALRAHGHNVAIVCRNRREILTPLHEAGFEPAVMRLGGALDIFSPIHIARIVRRFPGKDPVNIHVHNFKDAALAVKVRQLCADARRVRVICTRHLVKAGKARQQALYKALDSLIFVSERARAEFMKGCDGTVAGNISVIHNALPDADTLPCDASAQPPLILYAGRLSPEKGVHILVQALGRIAGMEWRARICGQGEGRYVMPLLRACRELGIADRVEWPGHVTDVTAEIAAAQIGVVPTEAPEAFGLSIIEMMRQGLPVITTCNGAQPEIITSGDNGLLVPPSDPDALAEALKRLVADPDERVALGASARQHFSKCFTYSDFYNSLIRHYV